jgi:chromosome segregation ATPase
MDERPFYEAGYHEVKGIRRVVIPFRRLLRRVLRPILVELDNGLISLEGRQVQLELRQAQLELRQAEFDVHQNDLVQRQNDLAERQNEFAERQNEFAERQNELAQRQNELAQRQTQLDDRQSALNLGDSAATDRLQNRLDRELKALLAMGWDHVAVTRRLAALEDHIEMLLSRASEDDLTLTTDGGDKMVIRYPGPNASTGSGTDDRTAAL